MDKFIDKSYVMSKAEQFSQWTIPSVFPPIGAEDGHLMTHPAQGMGAEAVNALANRLSIALFANSYPFFRLELDREARKASIAKFGESGTDARISEVERLAYRALKSLGLRSVTLDAIIQLIVTGNCCIHLPEEVDQGTFIELLTLRDYSVKRSARGVLIELEVVEPRLFSTLSEEHQKLLKQQGASNTYESDTVVDLTTHYTRTGRDEYTRVYKLDDLEVSNKEVYTRKSMPHQVLVWKLNPNAHYGTAYIEEFASEFKNYSLLIEAFTKGLYAVSDIKLLVRPGSVTDIDDLIESEHGAFVQGIPEDVRPLELSNAIDFKTIMAGAERIERRISRAFLTSGASIRNAERVTAYEINQVMQELERSLGGVFTALADALQKPLADYALRRVDPSLTESNGIELEIVTGAESLSRQGEMDKVIEWSSTMLKLYPEQFNGLVDVRAIAEYTASARSIDFNRFLKSEPSNEGELPTVPTGVTINE